MKPGILRWLARGLVTCCAFTGITAVAQPGFGGGGFGGGTTRSSASRNTSYPSSTDIGQARVTYDAETRSVIVVADEDTATHIKDMVKQLDRPTPQVLIKCIFLEATYSKDLDFGVEGTYKININGSKIGSVTPSTAFDLATSGGMVTVLGQDLNITLSALAKAGKTDILSRPSILARNNQQATINLGQRVPLISDSRFDNFGNQINSVTYENVGIILQVTPFITSDGFVEMVVSPQTSELADRSQWVPISSGGTNANAAVAPILAPVINSRTADTVVVVPDGQTVVIGGLMRSARLSSEEKVPFLGDIPLLGWLFKHKVTNNGKTELLIFLTPHIVKDPRDLRGVTDKERANSEMVPNAFTDEELDQYLNNVPPPQTNAPTKGSKKKK